ncbi:MAG: PAS domain S-box protein [Endozoicomonas sp.]
MDYSRQIVRLLALEDSPNDVERWVKLFRNAGLPPRVQHISSPESLEEALKQGHWDLMLGSEESTRLNARQAISLIQHHKQDIPVIVTLSEYNPEQATSWLSAGARDAIPSANEPHILHAVIRELTSLEDRRALNETRLELQNSNERCQLLLANATDAIAYIHDGMHVDANDAYLQQFGYGDTDELAGMPLIDMVGPEHQEQIRQLLKQIDSRAGEPLECQLSHTDGYYIPVSIRITEARYDSEPCIQLTIHPLSVPVLNQPWVTALSE